MLVATSSQHASIQPFWLLFLIICPLSLRIPVNQLNLQFPCPYTLIPPHSHSPPTLPPPKSHLLTLGHCLSLQAMILPVLLGAATVQRQLLTLSAPIRVGAAQRFPRISLLAPAVRSHRQLPCRIHPDRYPGCRLEFPRHVRLKTANHLLPAVRRHPGRRSGK